MSVYLMTGRHLNSRALCFWLLSQQRFRVEWRCGRGCFPAHACNNYHYWNVCFEFLCYVQRNMINQCYDIFVVVFTIYLMFFWIPVERRFISVLMEVIPENKPRNSFSVVVVRSFKTFRCSFSQLLFVHIM